MKNFIEKKLSSIHFWQGLSLLVAGAVLLYSEATSTLGMIALGVVALNGVYEMMA